MKLTITWEENTLQYNGIQWSAKPPLPEICAELDAETDRRLRTHHDPAETALEAASAVLDGGYEIEERIDDPHESPPPDGEF